MFALLTAAALAAEARLDVRNGVGRLHVDAPGEHVSPDAPATLTVGDTRVELRGDFSALRLPVPPGSTQVALSVALCTDGGTSCRQVVLGGVGEVGKSGSIRLVEGATIQVDTPAAAAPVAPPLGGVRVLDFGAVWCPPCNLMAAEVLHDPAATRGVPVEAIDVDQPASWPLKDRYDVGGYPTLVAVDADGRELDRLVGYPGPEETKAWFARIGGGPPIHTLLEGKAELSGADAAAAARRLAEGQRLDAARALLPKAADGVDLRVARLLTDPSEADARWLFEHDAPVGDWVFAALDAAPALWPQAVSLAATVPPVRGADLFYAASEHAPADVKPSLKAASLALLRTALTGDPEHDRGHVTFHATLLAELGDLDGALALLDANAARWPNEFTFTYAAARHLLDAGRLPEAEQKARAALQVAWGDQRLRAAVVLAKVLAARGQRPEAVLVIEGALREVPAPPPDVDVRTTRYRKELETLRAQLVAK
jgi:thiol-disulfide isomerase/thioredoxin/tetratricopeptide (TPR) repeat protein